MRFRDSLVPASENFINPIPPVTPLTTSEFLSIVEEVRLAITEGIYPTRISQGSSGSYFCRNRQGQIVGVFKPKNEEPYGKLNPKWTKWLHKNLFPCCFGRSCLIPNLGYISEAAASYIDRRLGLNIVPRTEIVSLASPTFYYSSADRFTARRSGEGLPPKIGSFQIFLVGFRDATTFFKEGYDRMVSRTSSSIDGLSNGDASTLQNSIPNHPLNWSERTQREFQWGFERLVVLDYIIRNTDRGLDNWMVKYTPEIAQPTITNQKEESRSNNNNNNNHTSTHSNNTNTAANDNSDNGRNCLVDIDALPTSIEAESKTNEEGKGEEGILNLTTSNSANHAQSLVEDFSGSTTVGTQTGQDLEETNEGKLSVKQSNTNTLHGEDWLPSGTTSGATLNGGVSSSSSNGVTSPLPSPRPSPPTPTILVAAIDNGLAFPYKHPDRWRSYPYGWSILPLAKLPFSSVTRELVLPLLTSADWWRETFEGLERLFRIDPDFNEAMWKKQRAVVRGQGYNLVEVLRRSELGDEEGSPLALVRRPVVAVYYEDYEHDPEGFREKSIRVGRAVKHRFESFAMNQPCFSWC